MKKKLKSEDSVHYCDKDNRSLIRVTRKQHEELITALIDSEVELSYNLRNALRMPYVNVKGNNVRVT